MLPNPPPDGTIPSGKVSSQQRGDPMINTASYAERLVREGEFTPKQAAALAQQRFEIEESMMTKADLANLATRQDISDLRAVASPAAISLSENQIS
ncbi:hypothetical protein GCM10027514_09250 [Azotobacter armeniacus]